MNGSHLGRLHSTLEAGFGFGEQKSRVTDGTIKGRRVGRASQGDVIQSEGIGFGIEELVTRS